MFFQTNKPYILACKPFSLLPLVVLVFCFTEAIQGMLNITLSIVNSQRFHQRFLILKTVGVNLKCIDDYAACTSESNWSN